MTRYLLFDSGCVVCTDVAQSIERATDGWLLARSLRSADMQELLVRARPDWRWEPTLIEVEGDQTRAYTGMALRAKLLAGIGPRKTLRVVQLVYQAMTPRHEADRGRRKFLKQGATILGGVVLGLTWGKSTPGAAAAPSAGTPNAKHIPASDPRVAHLQKAAAVQTASQHFGTPDWSNVYRVSGTAKNTQPVAYMIPYPAAPGGSVPQLTFLMIGDPATGDDTSSIVGQMHAGEQQSKVFAWFTADARALGTLSVREGQVTTAAPIVSGVAQPNFDGTCFLNCLGTEISVECFLGCLSCPTPSPFNLACGVCAVCAGFRAFLCIRQCQ